MIWLTWRLQRLELGVMAAILALLSVYLIATGTSIAALYHNLSPACAAAGGNGVPCDQLTSAITAKTAPYLSLFDWLPLVPLGFAILAAAPLLLQLEHGTYRLVWTQSATKEHWLVVMLGATLLMTVTAAAGLDLLTSWWNQPLDAVIGRWNKSFDVEGVVPIAYAVFAFALVTVAGALLRRSVAAIGVAFAGFLVARYAITTWLRPEYLAPLRYSWRIGHPVYRQVIPNSAWEVASGISNSHGAIFDPTVVNRICPWKAANAVGGQALTPCLRHHDWLYNTTLYQPVSRFWPFQFIESAMYLGMAAVLLGVAIWWVLKRLA